MNREIMATFRATTAKPGYLTVDKLEAGLGGWGSFTIGVWVAANVIAKEIQKGKRLKLEVTNEAFTDVDEIAEKAVKKLVECGADSANAALATAALLYWAGVNVQCGIPTPNRKLGAIARMAAKVPSGRVSSIPTDKKNNKLSGFAATLAIYQALDKENLGPYDSSILPLGAGAPLQAILLLERIISFRNLGRNLRG